MQLPLACVLTCCQGASALPRTHHGTHAHMLALLCARAVLCCAMRAMMCTVAVAVTQSDSRSTVTITTATVGIGNHQKGFMSHIKIN